MNKKILLSLIIFLIQLYIIPYALFPVYADVVQPGLTCRPALDTCAKDSAGKSYSCQSTSPGASIHQCLLNPIGGIFGTIQPPDALKKFIGGDPTGAGGISKLLSNLVALIYVIAAIVLILMILWGAYDWMTSEGEKEKIEKARNKIINALIGILLFAVAFAVIQVIGQFTGFTFFAGQK